MLSRSSNIFITFNIKKKLVLSKIKLSSYLLHASTQGVSLSNGQRGLEDREEGADRGPALADSFIPAFTSALRIVSASSYLLPLPFRSFCLWCVRAGMGQIVLSVLSWLLPYLSLLLTVPWCLPLIRYGKCLFSMRVNESFGKGKSVEWWILNVKFPDIGESHPFPVTSCSHPWQCTRWSQVVGFPSLGGQAPGDIHLCTENSHHWLAKFFDLDSFLSFQSVSFHQFSSSWSISTEDRSASTIQYNQISTWKSCSSFSEETPFSMRDSSKAFPSTWLEEKRLVPSSLEGDKWKTEQLWLQQFQIDWHTLTDR